MTTNSNDLLNLLLEPLGNRGYLWWENLYALLPQCDFFHFGPGVGPDRHPYIMVSLMPTSGGEKVKYDFINNYALDHSSGLAIALDGDKSPVPSVEIPYGCLWSYREFGDLRGTARQIHQFHVAFEKSEESPYVALNEGTNDQVLIGEPSFQFLPRYVREAITQEIGQIFGNVSPKFKLYEQKKYILSDRILIEPDVALTPEQSYGLGEYLSWYLPPYLPVIIGN